ncbi:MAG: 2-phosphosulfolactate phosphatase [Marinifilaceae bacterium]
MTIQRKLDICFSPYDYPLYRMDNSIVVVIDIFRATSVFCTALHNGARSIFPLAEVDQTREQRGKGFLLAGERDGIKIPDFDYGNSPYDFMTEEITGRQIAVTTTNGTQAINIVKKDAKEIVIGSFLNFSALVKYLNNRKEDILLLCSGWKNKMNFEDTIFASHLAQELLPLGYSSNSSDSIALAKAVADAAGKDILNYICRSSPRIQGRMSLLVKDFRFCLQKDQTEVVPVYHKGYLVDSLQTDG